jgi:predicted ArsR family transcriptional regulator
MKTQVFSLRIDYEVYKQFKEQCESEGRAITKVLRNIIIEYLKKNKKGENK